MQLPILLYDIGKWFGLIGFVFLALLIFSGDSARFWDRIFGLDKIIKFQRKFALFTSFFIIFHPLLFVLSGSPILNYTIPDFSVLPLALGIIALYIFIVVMIASYIYKRISYDIWQYIHFLTYILFFFSLYHAFNWGSDSNNLFIQILYAVSLILLVIGLIYRTQYKIRKRYSGKFFVDNIKWETGDTYTLNIRQERKIKFKAGQFCFLRLNKNKLHARHPFTIASSPDEQMLRFTIKNTGRFTETASKLQVGEEVLIDGPFGIFTERDSENDLVFIAGGVGITPFISMIRDHLFKNKKQNIFLLYCSKTKKDIIFEKELDSINESWLEIVYILNQDNILKSENNFEYGYITKTIVQKYIKNPDSSSFYICGPTAMKSATKKILNDLRIPEKNIHTENFFW